MPRLPARFKQLFSQTLAFLFVVSSTLFANWIWQKYTTEMDLKNALTEEKTIFLGVVRRVVEEADYNCTPGIGDSKCHFKLEAHQELLGSSLRECLSKNTIELLREIFRLGNLCNGGRTSKKVSPASVKSKSIALKNELNQIAASEPFANLHN